MNTVTGAVGTLKSGKSIPITQTRMADFKLDLGKKVWRLGIDPASKYTGIALMDEDNTFVILLDVHRNSKLPKEVYLEDLYYLLKRLVHGVKVSLIVNEKPFTKGYSRASDVLIALRGQIDTWVRQIPELAVAEYQKVYPQTWKAQIIDKKKGKSRFNLRGAVAEDLVDAFPVLRDYYESYSRGDYDSFDALGILVGYQKCAFTESGIPKICGMKEKSHRSFVGYQWVPIKEVGSQYSRKLFGEATDSLKPKFLLYNEDYSFLDNVTMASSNHDVVFTIVPEKELQQFQWKFGIDINQKDFVLLMFIFRKGKFTRGEMGYVMSKFEMCEEVTGG